MTLKHIKSVLNASAQGTTSSSAPIDSAGVKRSTTNAQTAIIYDVLSEGPIEGLVNGVASIRLNDNPVANSGNSRLISPQVSYDVNYVASTGVVTDNTDVNIFNGASTDDGSREVLIFGGSKRTTTSINCTAGNNIVVSTNLSNMTFAAGDVWDGDGVQPLIRIDGAGRDGGQLVAGVTEFINTAAIRVDTVPQTTVTNTAAYLDYKANVSSFSGNTATIASGGVNVANTMAIMQSPNRDAFAQPAYNYQNFGFAFRPGTREQQYLPTPAGIGSASVAHQVSGGNLGTTAGTGYPAPTGGGSSSFDFSQPKEAYTGTALTITSAAMGVGNPSEIDTVKATIAFNQMFSQKENGKLGEGIAEYRITFGYSRDGGTSFQDVVKVGRSDVSGRSNYYANGASRQYSSGEVRKKTKQPFNQVFTMDVSKYQPFDAYRLKFERITAVNQKENKWQQQNAGVIKQIENIITDKLSYPYSAYAAVAIDAEDFQQIPKRSYVIRGLKVKVPTNYFPKDELNITTGARRVNASYSRNVTTGADAGSVQDWDGNFRGDQKTFTDPTDPNYALVYTNNPIWVFYDLLTNQRYGLGKYLDEDFDFSQIDKYTLFQLAKYCDELVPDGKGGTEPRFTCNLYISKDTTAIKMLKNMASMVRSMLTWYNGQVTLGSNIQKGAVYAFNKSNVIGGEFAYSGTAGRFRHNQIAVTWNDPENGYKQAVEVVEDHDEIARTGKLRRKNITAYGCTSKGQAIRHGKYQLYTEKLETEIVTFATGLNGSMLKPGDVISVQDSDNTNIVGSGRVTTSQASTTTIIRTDRDLTSYLNTDDTFKLNLVYPSGGCYLTQASATINSTNYTQGDLILLDEDGAAIDTQAKASNLKDDAGNVVQTIWSDDVRVETQTISSFNASSVTVGSAFSSAPNGEVIFTISGELEEGGDVSGAPQEYIVTSVAPDENYNFSINAAEYHREKYDAVDRGWVIPTYAAIAQTPKRTDDIPVPIGVTTQIVPGNAGGGDAIGDGDTTNDFSIVINWSHPTTERTDSEGNSLTDVYEHLAGYRIQHNFDGPNTDKDANRAFTTVEVNSNNKTDFTVNQVVPGNYIVRVQTIATNGQTSGWVQKLCVFPEAAFTIFGQGTLGTGLTGAIQKGGVLTTVPNIESSNGTVTFANNTYVFTPPNGVDSIVVNSANTNFTQQTFPGMSDGDSAYLMYDYDGNTARGTTRSDPLRPVKIVEDTTAVDPDTGEKYNYQFLARCGQSNNDLTQANGTISTTAGLPEVTGSSTTFEVDFVEGDIIALDSAGTTRFMAKVAEITSNTALTLDAGTPRAYSGVTVHKAGLPIDHLKDTIIGEVQRSGSTYTYIPFTNKQGISHEDEVGANTITSVGLAGNSITSVQISANSIGAAAIVAGSIGSAEVAADAIGSVQIAAGAIDDTHIQANSIDATMISANSIGSSEISANSIGAVAITANAVGSAEIAANAIGTVAIEANSITAAQLTSDAVGSFTVTANSITSTEIQSNSIEAVHLAANSVSSIEIAANSIDSAEIKLNAVNGTIIAGNSVSGTQISANSVNGIIISTGAVDSTQIAGSAISAAKIAADAVVNEKIANNAVTTDEVAANAIETNQLKSNSVTAAIVVANAIGSNEIAANSVNAVIIAANSIEANQLKANSVNAVAILANAIENNQIAANSINSVVIQQNAVGENEIAASSISTAKIQSGAITNAKINSSAAIDFAKISADNSITNAHISAGGAIDIAKISIGTGDIDIAKINIDNGEIDFAKIAIGNGQINTAVLAANVITNAKISSTDNMTITLTDGSAGGWAVTSDRFSSTNASGGGNASFTSAGVILGSAGFISAKNFYIDTAGNAKFKGDISGATGSFNGSLTVGSSAQQTVAAAQSTASNAASAASVAQGTASNAATAASTAQSTADSKTTASAAASAANSQNKTGGSVGGWTLTAATITGGSSVGGSDGNFATGTGIVLGSTGYLSSKNFYIDSSGNAKFKGTLEGDDITVNGTLVLPSSGANVSGVTIGSWSTNTFDNKHIVSIGSGPGFYQGFVRVTGGTHYVKTVSIQIRTGSSTASEGTLIYETPRIDQYTAGNVSEGRLYTNTSPVASGNMPIAFTYTGAGNVSAFVRAQADSGPDRLGIGEARFIKFGTTDPVFSFANQSGVALSTAIYSNTQVVGGFAGTKTVSINNTSFTRFKIDNGSFGTANANIANGSYINVEITSASTNLTARTSTVTIGESTQDFTVTTGGTSGSGGSGGSGGGLPGGGCFVQGTPIVMADGSLKNIEDVTSGESVKSFRHSSLSLEEDAYKSWTATEIGSGSFGTSNVVTVTDPHEHTNYYWINYNLKVTNEHPMLAFKDGVFKFVQVQDLRVGDFLICENGTREEIFAIPKITQSCITHNMDVEDDDTYVVKGGNNIGYIAHNITGEQKV